jgi:hypothetical protein
MLKAFSKKDPPPHRVKPVPVAVLCNVVATAATLQCPHRVAMADMTILAFFFLLRPGEYTGGSSDTAPFHFQDVHLFIGPTRLDLATASITSLRQATFGTLTFTNQKNGVRNEVIGHASSGDPVLCPVQARIRRVIHLRMQTSPPTMPLATWYQDDHPQPILPRHITDALRTAVMILSPTLGFLPEDVLACCLHAAGTTALLCADVDDCHISLLGRWRSDEMLCYIHLSTQQKMKDFSHKMLHGGVFNLIPNQLVLSY